MRGEQVPPGLFFPAASRITGGADNRAIDAPQFPVDFASVEICGSQTMSDLTQRSRRHPTCRTDPIRQWPKDGTPPAGRAKGIQFSGPEKCIDDDASIPWWPSRSCRGRGDVLNEFAFVIRKPMSRHPPWLGSSHHSARLLRSRK